MSRGSNWQTRILVLVAGLTALSIGAPEAAPRIGGTDAQAQSVFRDARGYTVRIRTRIEAPFGADKLGSFFGAGFLVDAERRWLLTNAHVVGESPSEVEVAFADGEFQPAKKIYVDSFTDVAVLQVEHIPTGRRPAILETRDEVAVGETVGAFGHPLGMHFTGTRGIVSNVTDQAGPDLLQIDATVDHGNSGGPVISLRSGRVIGIATAGFDTDKSDRMNFATPLKDVLRIIKLLKAGESPVPTLFEFTLLRNDQGSHTMEVGATSDPVRWPLQSGDRIESVEGVGEVQTYSKLVTALRGCRGSARLSVLRNGKSIALQIAPAMAEPVLERRGLGMDGALISSFLWDDGAVFVERQPLRVEFVMPGSAAEAQGLSPGDRIESIDGVGYASLEALRSALHARPEGKVARIVLRRWSPSDNRIFDFHVRELPMEEIVEVGPQAEEVAAR
ncbi:MAG: trypsin-like serine protease [Candidatus Eisenbacteria bacterium]|uniref:Trypsin-like serine protease n=1 Tax=Eiseniibacteriota bacterium TaxID=2212470 RepID=A0A849SP63_UNCEI|nr:trypsin-like serine protease [Candidatus Eisenbacteria bacterium]